MADDQIVVYFNNCRCRDHAAIYGDGAFYDLNATGRQANEAVDLPVGQECVVATIARNKQIVFKWYSFLRETRLPDDTGTVCRAFFGDFRTAQVFSKKQAAREKLYSVFFNVRGHFKQQSTIPSPVPQKYRPTRRKRTVSFLPEEVLEAASINELRALAVSCARSRVPLKKRSANYRVGSLVIHRYVLCRAHGQCESCSAPAPFRKSDGSPYLEPHHTTRLADNGPDHPSRVIGLCPNCHRHAHYSADAKSFNSLLKRKLASLETHR